MALPAINIGQSLPLGLSFVDPTTGNPLSPQPTIDPGSVRWSDTTPATDTLIAAADGMSAVALADAAGSDTLSVTLTVGGQTFSATAALTVNAAALNAQLEIVNTGPATP